MVLHVEMLARLTEGQYIVYEKQRGDDVMSCLDAMQMNEKIIQACLQHF